jgi:hypothetical protein
MKKNFFLFGFSVLISFCCSAQSPRNLSTLHNGTGGVSTNTVLLGGIAYTNVTAGCQSGGIMLSSSNQWQHCGGFLQAVDIKRPTLDTDHNGIINELDMDNDGDNLTDLEEITGSRFSPARATDVNNADSDGDQMSDGGEYVADTDPLDADSVFYIDGIREENTMLFEFVSSSNRIYTLESLVDVFTSEWQQVTGQIDVPGTGASMILSDTNALTVEHHHHRILVEVP